MISVSDARRLLREHAVEGPVETLPLALVAGRVLRESLCADLPAPPYDRIMMDGLALCACSWSRGKRFHLQALVGAGSAAPSLDGPDHVVGVATGGRLPEGCDAVAPVEWCEADGDLRVIAPPADRDIQPGLFVHREGSDGAAGRQVLPVGQRLGPAELAIAATEGRTRLVVNALPRMVLIVTGDEVVPPDRQPGPGQIRASHPAALHAFFQRSHGLELRHRHAPDDPERLASVIGEALDEADIVLVTGGVSRGHRDWVPAVLARLGVTSVFHGVAQKPGKPLWFGRRDETLVFGLPGNPVSALACTRLYVSPIVDRWCGSEPRPALRGEIRDLPPRLHDLTLFVPIRLASDGGWRAAPPATSGSLHALCDTQALAECSPDPADPIFIHTWSPSV
jgi:molybdopterin molybdotransferase